MNFDIKLITDWRFLVPATVALFSLAFSVFNFILGKIVATKITQNDLKHVNADIEDLRDADKNLRDENKELKTEIKEDLEKIFSRLGKIDKGLAVRKVICEERHKEQKDK